MNRKRKDNPRLCISHVPLILLMLCLYVKEGFVVCVLFPYFLLFSSVTAKSTCYAMREKCFPFNWNCIKTLNVIVYVSQMNFPTGCWKTDDKKSCGTLDILTVGKLKSLKKDIKSRKKVLFKRIKRDYQIRLTLQKDYAQRNQEVNRKLN